MNGYCIPGKIYYCIADKTSFAKFPDGFSESCLEKLPSCIQLIETGSYKGEPPYKNIKGKLSETHKQYHSAEHMVHNCFMKKIKDFDKDTSLDQLASKVPSLEEVKCADNFSVFCGTTVFLFSGLALILAALPNIFSFHNHNIFFMFIWLTATILVAKKISELIQRKFFLAQAKDHQIILAIQALKEVLKHE